MKILAFSPIKADGTSFYRGFGPLNHLEKYYDVQVTNGSLGPLEISWDLITRFDLIFFQRPSSAEEADTIRVAKKLNRPIVVDYDDDYLSIPDTNPRSGLYKDPHRMQNVLRCIELADHVIVSTPALKESLVKNTKKDPKRIHIIPNAVDEKLFDLSRPLSKRNDIVLWRGGDTHGHDIAPYLDKMVALYEQFPEYKWAFMGYAPESFLERVNSDRILLYPFADLASYFNWLFELRPKLMIVPLVKNPFNEAKSNCSWLEATLAGAACVFPNWSTEFAEGMIGYEDPESFHRVTAHALLPDNGQEIIRTAYEDSFMTLCRHFTLSKHNSSRLELFNKAIAENPLNGKIGVNHPKYTIEGEPYTDKDFYNYAWERHYVQDNEIYRKWHHGAAEWLVDTYRPKSVVEFGCGPGAMIEKFCDLRVPQVAGFDTNEHFKCYFLERNPHYGHAYYVGNFLDAELEGVFDLCVAVEVFEHIPDDLLLPFIAKMADHFRVLFFSSTPYRDTKVFDKQWGHCSIRTHEGWKALFEANGFVYHTNPQKITQWDAVFFSKKLMDKPE